MMFNALK